MGVLETTGISLSDPWPFLAFPPKHIHEDPLQSQFQSGAGQSCHMPLESSGDVWANEPTCKNFEKIASLPCRSSMVTTPLNIRNTRKTRKTSDVCPENPKNPKNLRSMPGKPEEPEKPQIYARNTRRTRKTSDLRGFSGSWCFSGSWGFSGSSGSWGFSDFSGSSSFPDSFSGFPESRGGGGHRSHTDRHTQFQNYSTCHWHRVQGSKDFTSKKLCFLLLKKLKTPIENMKSLIQKPIAVEDLDMEFRYPKNSVNQETCKQGWHEVWKLKEETLSKLKSAKADNGFPGQSAHPLHYYYIKGTSPIDCWYGP